MTITCRSPFGTVCVAPQEKRMKPWKAAWTFCASRLNAITSSACWFDFTVFTVFGNLLSHDNSLIR